MLCVSGPVDDFRRANLVSTPRSPTSTSTTQSGGRTDTPSKVAATATPASKCLNALLGMVSGAGRAPVIVATRLRKGSANSARGAARLVADSLKVTKACGVGGSVILRADSAVGCHAKWFWRRFREADRDDRRSLLPGEGGPSSVGGRT